MAYQKQSFVDGETVLSAEHLNHIETGIMDVEASIPTVPTTMPNPNALTFTGAVEDTYDGSSAKTIDIPTVFIVKVVINSTTITSSSIHSKDKTFDEIFEAYNNNYIVVCDIYTKDDNYVGRLALSSIGENAVMFGAALGYDSLATCHISTDESDENFAYKKVASEELASVPRPNPYSLKFTGAVNAEYDGSTIVTIPLFSDWKSMMNKPFGLAGEVVPESYAVFNGSDGEPGQIVDKNGQPIAFTLTTGEEYEVSLAKVNTICTCVELEPEEGLVAQFLGNLALMEMGEDTGENFLVVVVPTEEMYAIISSDYADTFVDFSITGGSVKTLDDKYLSDNIVRKDDQAFQESIVQQVITALGTPVFGRVDENNNIILAGNLVDGTYNLKYEDAEGNLSDLGSVEVGMSPDVLLNLNFGKIDSSAGTIDGVGTDVTYLHSDLIEITSGYNYTLTMKAGCELSFKVCYWDANGNFLSTSEGLCEYPTTDTDISIPIISGAASFRTRFYNLDYNWNGMNTDTSIRPQYIEYINTMVSLKREKTE